MAAGSLPESTTLKQVNSITNRISQRKSRTRRREDAAGGEERWASDENQTSDHSSAPLCLPLCFSSKGPIPLCCISTVKPTKLFTWLKMKLQSFVLTQSSYVFIFLHAELGRCKRAHLAPCLQPPIKGSPSCETSVDVPKSYRRRNKEA